MWRMRIKGRWFLAAQCKSRYAIRTRATRMTWHSLTFIQFRQNEQMNNKKMSTAPYHYSCLPRAVPLQCFLCLSTRVIFVSLCLAIVQLAILLCYSCLSVCLVCLLSWFALVVPLFGSSSIKHLICLCYLCLFCFSTVSPLKLSISGP